MKDTTAPSFTYFGLFVDDDGPETHLFDTLDEARRAVAEFRRDLVALGEAAEALPDLPIVRVTTVPIDHVSLRDILNKSGNGFIQTREVVEIVANPASSGATVTEPS